VISGAGRGALRAGGRRFFRSRVGAHTTTAAISEISSLSQPGRLVSASSVMTVQLVKAPTISTSPCAKLIRLMMP
jgi:hypothetical protein